MQTNGATTRPPCVVTGMGLYTPIGHGPEAFWDALMTGRAGAAEVRSFDTSLFQRHVACEIAALPTASGAFDAAVYGGGRCAQLLLLGVQAALADAGLTPADLAGRRVAVLAGTTMGEFEFIERIYDDSGGGSGGSDERSFAGSTAHRAVAHESAAQGAVAPEAKHPPQPPLGRGGEKRAGGGLFAAAVRNAPGRLSRIAAEAIGAPTAKTMDVYGACAAGNMALIMAMDLLAAEYDIVLAGGVDAFSRFAFVGFMRNRVMAKDCCRPYDAQRDGLLVGEGAGLYVVERERDARGRKRYARLLGGGTTCDAFNPTQPRPDGSGIEGAIRGAEADSGVSCKTMGYICSHGTGTPRNDLTEWETIDRCFNPGTPFSSIKALTGHTMGAAGAIEAAACMLAMQHQTLVPNWNLDQPAAAMGTQPVRKAEAARLARTVNLSFGFGGYNSCLFLARE